MVEKYKGKQKWRTRNLILFISFVLFAFLIYSVVNYFITINIVGRERKEINQAILQHVVLNVETNILNIEEIANDIVDDFEYSKFVNSLNGELSAFEVYQLQRKIQSEVSKSDYIDSIYLYSPGNNKILSNFEYVSADTLFEKEWLEEASTENEHYLHKCHMGLDNNKKLKIIVLNRFQGDKGEKGLVIIDINSSLFRQAFELEEIEDFMNIRITDKDNLVLYDANKKNYIQEEVFFEYNGDTKKDFSKLKIENDYYDTYYRYSDVLDWEFFIFIPHFLSILKYYPVMCFMLILIVVFLGVAYAVFKRLERTTLLPVDDFVAGISSYVDCNYKDISYENLESLYNFVVENDQSMKKQISSSLLALRWRLIMEILSGSKKSFADFEFQLKMLEMPMYPSNFMVMVIELERRKELQFSGFKDFIGVHMETILKEIENITSEDGVKCVSLKMHDDNIVCVFSFLDNTLESNISRTMTYANVLKSNVFAKTGEAMNIGIGGYYVDFRNVSDSYREAMIALERKFLFGKNSIISIEDIRFPGEADVFGISKKIELLKSIGIEKMSKRVDDIFEDMLLSNVDYEVFYMFAVQIVLAIFDNENIKEYKNDIIADEVFVDVYTYLNQFDVLTDAKNYVLELVEEIKKRIASASEVEVSNERMIETIVAYIHKNYTNPELSLHMVSAEMGYNVSYISREFKKVMRTNFIDYLIEVRIKKAKDLLINSNEKVAVIGQMVGYTNPNSFMRIFKQNVGVTPTVYRNNKSKSSNEG